MLWPQNFKKYNLLCWYEEDFIFWGGGGAGCLQMERVGMMKKKEKYGRRGSTELSYINFFRRFHRRKLCRWLRRWFWRKYRHITVRICHFKSLGESVGNLNGEPVTSLYVLSFWIRRWFCRKKITRQNLHVSDPPFFKFGNFSVHNSVGNYRRTFSVGSYRLNYGRKSFCR